MTFQNENIVFKLRMQYVNRDNIRIQYIWCIFVMGVTVCVYVQKVGQGSYI
jgi:hypothetical protein